MRGLFGTVRRETVSENLERRLQRKQKVTYLLTYLGRELISHDCPFKTTSTFIQRNLQESMNFPTDYHLATLLSLAFSACRLTSSCQCVMCCFSFS